MTEKRLRWQDLRIGDKAGPIQYDITEEIIDAFARATDDYGEWHMKDSPFSGRIAHVTLNITDYSLMLSKSHGVHSGLHSRQQSEFFLPMKLGDAMTSRGEIIDLFQRKGRDYYVVLYEAVNQHGQLATRHRLTTTVDPDGPPPVAAPAPSTAPAESKAPREAAPPPGPELPPITRLFTRETMAKFASQTSLRVGVRKHAHSTHTDPDLAKSVGLPEVVAQSTHYYSWYSEMMLKFLGEGWVCGGKIEAKFFGMVFPGDLVTARGWVKEVKKEGNESRVFVKVEAYKQDGQAVSVGTASGLAGKRIPGPGWPIGKVPSLEGVPHA